MTQVQRKDDRAAAVHVAAFGKHPGWDDHIEEIGLDTDWLVAAKRILYTDCIGGCVDSGEWEKLEEDKRLPFGHNFLWRTPEAVIVGRMWASRDGKGRTKYPMIVCAAVDGAGAEWTVSQVLPRLAAIEAKCSGTSSAEMVRLALGELRTELEAAAANRGQTTMMQSSGGLLSRLLASPALSGENRTGLQRVLYEMGRELQEFRSTGTTSIKPRAYVPACQHIRVPRGLPAPGEGARAWLAVMDQEITHAAPLLVLEPNGQRFLDIIVGEPKPKVFLCARSGEQALALTSDVPYSMDAVAVAEAESKINAWSQGRASTGGELVAAPEPVTAAKSNLKLVLLGAAGILLVIIVIALVKMTKKSPAEAAAASLPGAAETEAPRRTTHSAPPAAQPSNDPADPRTGWKLDTELARARESLEAADRELAYEHAPALKAQREALEDVAERAAIVRSTQWRDTSREVIAHDVAEVDGALASSVAAIGEARRGITSRVRAGLDQRAANPPVRSPAFAAAWTAGLKNIDDGAGWAASRAKADALESALKQADAALAAVREPALPADWADTNGTLKRAADARRERAVREAVEAAATGDGAGVTHAAEGLRQWNQQAGAMLTAINDLGHAADNGEAAAIAQAESAVNGSPLAAELAPLAAPALARGQAAASVGTQSQPSALVSMVREAGGDATGAKAPLAVAAWTRLAALHWPQSPVDLETASTLCTRELKTALDHTPDAARRRDLSGRAAAATATMWRNYAAGAGDEAGVAAVSAAQRAMGVDDQARQALPARARYNLARHDLGRGASGGGSASIRAFITAVDGLGSEVASRPEVSRLLTALRPLADPMSDVDLAKLGPGSAGWKAAPPAADSSLTYTWEHAGQMHTLTFRSVSVAGAPAFVCTCEVSAGLFIDAVTATHKWDDVKAEMPRYPVGGEDPRRGPRVWEWTASSDAPMAISKPGKGDLSKGWLRVRPQMAGKDCYPEGAKVDPPSRAHPMQYVSPRAAVLMARATGCRLPTTSEWQAANGANSAQAQNLRDASFRQQFVRTEQLKAFLPDFPAAGIFWPRETQKKVEADKDGVAAVETDDGTIWFMPVSSGPGFQHLIGNVAEYVWDDAASLEGLEATGAKVKTAMGKGDKLRIIGGSALSSKDVAVNEPQPVAFTLAGGGYSDVGFRLAFSAPAGSGGEGFAAKLNAALAASPYLPPSEK